MSEPRNPCLIVAELSSNPSPMWDLSRYLDAAAACGADAVKVQLFFPEHFPPAERADKKAAMFPRDQFPVFVADAHARGLLAGASVFDAEAVAMCWLLADFIKLATREEHNLPLRLRAWFTGLPVYRSVDWRRARKRLRLPRETTLGCIPQYPSLATVDNLPIGLEDKLGRPFGWSSHSGLAFYCIAAAKQGAAVIEAHLCLSPKDAEAAWSLIPATFNAMARAIRRMGL